MPTLSRFISGFLTAGDVELCRLVLDTANPQKNFCKAASLTLKNTDLSRREFDNIGSLTNATSTSDFELLLSKMLELFASKSAKSVNIMKTSKAISYELYNVNEKFETQLQDDRVKKWLEKYRKKTRIYMVVALHTVQDVSVTLDASESSEMKAQVTVPVGGAADALAPSASATTGVTGDVQGQAGRSHAREQSASFVAPGERIVAVGYQAIRFRFFQDLNDTADPPALAKNTVWKSFDTSRAADCANMVEAAVEDVSELSTGIQVAAESVGPNGKFIILQDQIGRMSGKTGQCWVQENET